MRLVHKLVVWLWQIKNRQRIPRISSRLYSSAYNHIDTDSARIMARYGIRSPSGIRAAMKKYKTNSIDELVAQLEHHRAKRNLLKRLLSGLRRARGGTPYNPHSREIRQLFSRRYDPDADAMKARIRRLKQGGEM